MVAVPYPACSANNIIYHLLRHDVATDDMNIGFTFGEHHTLPTAARRANNFVFGERRQDEATSPSCDYGFCGFLGVMVSSGSLTAARLHHALCILRRHMRDNVNLDNFQQAHFRL